MESKNTRKTCNNTPQPERNIPINLQNQSSNNDCFYFDGDRLFTLLHSLQRQIKSELQSNNILPEKLWFKQHFAVGVNEVTRLLERTPPFKDSTFDTALEGSSRSIVNHGRGCRPCTSVIKLQAVLIASDCNSRWLTKHLPSLATSRNVPIIYVKDNKEGSLRLGEVVKVKTAIALGIKAKGSGINKCLEELLHQHKLNVTGCLDSTELATVSCQ